MRKVTFVNPPNPTTRAGTDLIANDIKVKVSLCKSSPSSFFFSPLPPLLSPPAPDPVFTPAINPLASGTNLLVFSGTRTPLCFPVSVVVDGGSERSPARNDLIQLLTPSGRPAGGARMLYLGTREREKTLSQQHTCFSRFTNNA